MQKKGLQLGFSELEMDSTRSIASIYMMRMLGLFMVLPVLSIYAGQYEGSTPLLMGLAMGVYGLTQACFQIPFGMLSDRYGRKPILFSALLIFALGSAVAAMADTIGELIIGRALQGCGAVAAVLLAFLADLTREENRTKAMAMVGMSIGASFMLAMIIGPLVSQWIGLSGIFWITGGLACVGLFLTLRLPTPTVFRQHRDTQTVPALLKEVLMNKDLLRLDIGVFILHLVLTATFLVIPLALQEYAGLELHEHWKVYLGVMVLSILPMLPLIILAEKYQKIRGVFVGVIVFLAFAELGLSIWYNQFWILAILLWVFFSTFNVLEAILPSLLSKTVSVDKKGTAMGVYSSMQFLGAFSGGILGGYLYGEYGIEGTFMLCALCLGLWVFIAIGMQSPKAFSTQLLNVGVLDDMAEAMNLSKSLEKITGVVEAIVIAENGVAYLKVDKNVLDTKALAVYSKSFQLN
jgi:MFS family permease